MVSADTRAFDPLREDPRFQDEEVDAAVEALLSAMEPIMIVVLGTVVGGMIVAMHRPIFDMINAVQ